MTRFLSRLLSDPRCGADNSDTSRLFDYHQATKHTYHSVRQNARYLDWNNQPDPFRTYEGARTIALPPEPGFPNVGTFATMASLKAATLSHPEDKGTRERRPELQLNIDWLGRLLWHSMAVSAWKVVPGSGTRYSLRVNPSSGNLHPTEIYIAPRGFQGIEDGFYHYRPDRHTLELRSRGAWTPHLAQALEISWAGDAQLIVALTSIFWREAWKYGARAYRYCCHDLGHAITSVLLAAHALGLPGGAIGHFSDRRLARAMGLEDGDEAPMAFLAFPQRGVSPEPPPSPVAAVVGTPNELSVREISYELLLGIHAATILPDPAGPLPHVSRHESALVRAAPDPAAPARDAPLGQIARKRRSALDFEAVASPMARDELQQLLDFATRDWRADWRGNFGENSAQTESGVDLVALYLYVHRVRDCEPGVYLWDRATRNLQLLHPGNVQRVAAFLSLEQSLAGNSCFTISMIADLGAAARAFGNRGYRYVYFEAGAIGQKLYLGAETLGWNATGIGAFYDDDVHRYLGFLEEEESDSVGASVRAGENASLIMLGSPASRARAQDPHALEDVRVNANSGEAAAAATPAQTEEEKSSKERDALPGGAVSGNDPRALPRQVIYHFAVGRAVRDPRLEAEPA